MLEKEVGSGCKGELIQQELLLIGGGRRGWNKTIQKATNKGGAGTILKVVIIEAAESKDWAVNDWGSKKPPHYLVTLIFLETG